MVLTEVCKNRTISTMINDQKRKRKKTSTTKTEILTEVGRSQNPLVEEDHTTTHGNPQTVPQPIHISMHVRGLPQY